MILRDACAMGRCEVLSSTVECVLWTIQSDFVSLKCDRDQIARMAIVLGGNSLVDSLDDRLVDRLDDRVCDSREMSNHRANLIHGGPHGGLQGGTCGGALTPVLFRISCSTRVRSVR
jgi:hypothetical protein